MIYFNSTKNNHLHVNIETAILKGLPDDNGLYMPESIPVLGPDFWNNADGMTFTEIALEMSFPFFEGSISKTDLGKIINHAFDFESPTIKLNDNLYCLELFHGPSMAFKDFGARFMAGIMAHYLSKSDKKITILVATSGDTGGAVAQGFFGHKNIEVIILYPSGKVSEIQEKQLTTLGGNISTLEVRGTFDDCQRLVKSAFLDSDLKQKHNLASANSINIARLIPQSFYYAYCWSRLKGIGKPIVFSVPSGNFGNLSAGIIAQRMGMPTHKFIAATNINKVVPEFLKTGVYNSISPSETTISNAMDVGNPSNFPRLLALHENNIELLRSNISGFWFDDNQTREAMLEIYNKYDYTVCPHTAVAYLGLKEYINKNEADTLGVFLSTAHYAKFLDEVQPTLNHKVEIPERLSELLNLEKKAVGISSEFNSFKNYLLKK